MNDDQAVAEIPPVVEIPIVVDDQAVEEITRVAGQPAPRRSGRRRSLTPRAAAALENGVVLGLP